MYSKLTKLYKSTFEFFRIVVNNKIFNTAIMLCVMLSVISLLVPQLVDFSNRWDLFFEKADIIFLVIFTLEFLIKFWIGKWKYFLFDYGWIDFLSSLPILTPAIKSMRSVKLLRFTRALRIFRLLKFTKETQSQLKQKFFAGLSSFTLIVILSLGYIIFNYQADTLLNNEIKYLKLIKSSIESGSDIKNIFNNEPSILRIQSLSDTVQLTELNKYKELITSISPDNIEKVRYNNFGDLKKIIEWKFINNRKSTIAEFEKLSKSSVSDTEFFNNIDNVDNKFFNGLIAKTDWRQISSGSFSFISGLLNSELFEYFHFQSDFNIISNDFDKIKKVSIDEQEILFIKTSNNYLILYSLKNLSKGLHLLEAFIVGISILTVIVTIIVLNFYLDGLMLRRIVHLSSELKENIISFKAKRNIAFDDTDPFKKLSATDDEINMLTRSYEYLIKKLNDSFDRLYLYINRIETLNTVYSHFQQTYDIEKHFNYIIISLTSKIYLKYDRAAIFIKNSETGKFYCFSAIGANTREELIKKFSNKEEYYKFNPKLSDALQMYDKLPYYGNSFEKLAKTVEFDAEKVKNNLESNFAKHGMSMKFPNTNLMTDEIINGLKAKFESSDFIVSQLKFHDKFFGFIYADNYISKEEINVYRIQNTELFINEMLVILNNLLFLPYLSEREKVEGTNKNIVFEKNKSYSLIDNILS
ncbi:ion transporter [Candidatus Dependentiae bacterium]|nr:ion transporter [Candidatus Dependentiae bacterium]